MKFKKIIKRGVKDLTFIQSFLSEKLGDNFISNINASEKVVDNILRKYGRVFKGINNNRVTDDYLIYNDEKYVFYLNLENCINGEYGLYYQVSIVDVAKCSDWMLEKRIEDFHKYDLKRRDDKDYIFKVGYYDLLLELWKFDIVKNFNPFVGVNFEVNTSYKRVVNNFDDERRLIIEKMDLLEDKIDLLIEEEKKTSNKTEFKPQNTAINIGNSYSARVLASEVNTNEKILDYGCGSGRNIKYIIECLRENNPSVSIDGCDIIEQLEKEKENHNKLRKKGCIIVESNLLEKNKYDKILNSHVLNVIESDEIKNIVIKDVYNKLKKGGKAYFEVRTKSDVEGAKTKEKYGDGWKIKKGKYFTYQEAISKEKMEKMLIENGFEIVQHICNSSKHFVVVSK